MESSLSLIALILSGLSILWHIFTYIAGNYAKLKFDITSVEGLNPRFHEFGSRPSFERYTHYWLIVKNLSRRPTAVTGISCYRRGNSISAFIDDPVELSPWSIRKIPLQIGESRPLPRFLVVEDIDYKSFQVIDFLDSKTEELLKRKVRKFRTYDKMMRYIEKTHERERIARNKIPGWKNTLKHELIIADMFGG